MRATRRDGCWRMICARPGGPVDPATQRQILRGFGWFAEQMALVGPRPRLLPVTVADFGALGRLRNSVAPG